MVYTPMISGEAGLSDAERQARAARSLLQTEGTAWDVGAAVRFLASDESRWMTGKFHQPYSKTLVLIVRKIGAIVPLDAGTTAATGIGSASLYASRL